MRARTGGKSGYLTVSQRDSETRLTWAGAGERLGGNDLLSSWSQVRFLPGALLLRPRSGQVSLDHLVVVMMLAGDGVPLPRTARVVRPATRVEMIRSHLTEYLH